MAFIRTIAGLAADNERALISSLRAFPHGVPFWRSLRTDDAAGSSILPL